MARTLIDRLNESNLLPTRLFPSAEGGIVLAFIKDQLYADIECFNDGEIIANLMDRDNGPCCIFTIIPGDTADFGAAVERIRTFLSR